MAGFHQRGHPFVVRLPLLVTYRSAVCWKYAKVAPGCPFISNFFHVLATPGFHRNRRASASVIRISDGRSIPRSHGRSQVFCGRGHAGGDRPFACRRESILRSHPAMWFQLTKMRLTISSVEREQSERLAALAPESTEVALVRAQ